MTGKKGGREAWHETVVVLRADICRLAAEKGIDISDACNRALAVLTGAEYPAKEAGANNLPRPVIIARNGSLPRAPDGTGKGPAKKLHPVINADDPAAPARVALAKTPVKRAPEESQEPVTVPAARPVPSPADETIAAPSPAEKKPASRKGRAGTAKKQPKGDRMKVFFSQKIARTDDPKATVSKDELYGVFTRFCREHQVTTVPDRRTVTIALKNQFALSEENIDGVPCWTGIRLK
ncbi:MULTISPECIES: hypothetical protein [unclassified Methanoregula]|uniref:hypothetical protein n=1 Tax=unclassified Methanoregula TaxID=2649730 RepID=UPI0009D23F56|nr:MULTISPECIES: hypothetical protein [unclassified Methanoregula]OPX64946.1 MAG: hypothetical protein A4E33_00684 [Methanoregula sp. PtaB.Bin085]OPY32998.1 MAG: hypothetical protein A4E34_02375 [Methanoregula sp. PtaU1.Bin006]